MLRNNTDSVRLGKIEKQWDQVRNTNARRKVLIMNYDVPLNNKRINKNKGFIDV